MARWACTTMNGSALPDRNCEVMRETREPEFFTRGSGDNGDNGMPTKGPGAIGTSRPTDLGQVGRDVPIAPRGEPPVLRSMLPIKSLDGSPMRSACNRPIAVCEFAFQAGDGDGSEMPA